MNDAHLKARREVIGAKEVTAFLCCTVERSGAIKQELGFALIPLLPGHANDLIADQSKSNPMPATKNIVLKRHVHR